MGLAQFAIENAKFIWFTVVMLVVGGILSFLSLTMILATCSDWSSPSRRMGFLIGN